MRDTNIQNSDVLVRVVWIGEGNLWGGELYKELLMSTLAWCNKHNYDVELVTDQTLPNPTFERYINKTDHEFIVYTEPDVWVHSDAPPVPLNKGLSVVEAFGEITNYSPVWSGFWVADRHTSAQMEEFMLSQTPFDDGNKYFDTRVFAQFVESCDVVNYLSEKWCYCKVPLAFEDDSLYHFLHFAGPQNKKLIRSFLINTLRNRRG